VTRQDTRVEDLADRVISADLVAQEAVPAWRKPSPTAGMPIWQPAGVGKTGPNWMLIGLVGIVVVGLIGVGAAYAFLGGQTPQPTAVALQPTPSATPTHVTATPVVTTPAPTATQVASTPVTTSPVEVTPPATSLPLLRLDALDEHLGAILTDGIGGQLAELGPDAAGDTYLPHDGSPATSNQQYIDLLGAGAFLYKLSDAQAVALSSFPCGSESERDGLTLLAACNQPGPMPATDYVVFASYWSQQLPDPFPQDAQCVYIVQADVDNDRTTGFQSSLGFNHLIGADLYYENLFFWDQQGQFRNYILATDEAQPPRPDTGEIHGNLVTSARWFGSIHDAGAGAEWVHTAWIPAEQFASDMYSVGGFCDADRAAADPADFAVDALGDARSAPFPMYFEVGMPQPVP
jgi:hypothetical protein